MVGASTMITLRIAEMAAKFQETVAKSQNLLFTKSMKNGYPGMAKVHICGNSYDSYGDLCIYIVRDHKLSTCIYPSISAHHAQDSAQYRPCLSAVDALQDTARYCKTNCLSSFLVLGSLESLQSISWSFLLFCCCGMHSIVAGHLGKAGAAQRPCTKGNASGPTDIHTTEVQHWEIQQNSLIGFGLIMINYM
jgi:hypothetical protein